MKIPQKLKESNLLHKIISILTKKFPKLFQINSFGRPRKYQLGKVLALIVYCAKNNGNLSYRKIVKALKEDLFLVEILGFKSIPDFSIIFKIYKKYLKDNFNLYMAEITKSISKGLDVLYIDSSSLITNKLDKDAGIGKSTRLDWYYGYKVHLICSKDGLPLVFNITKANVSDINCKNLIDSLKINLNREKTFIIGDKGYDSAKLLKYIKSKGMYLLCPLNKRKAKTLSSQNIKDPLRRFNYELLKEKVCKIIYRKRWEIERLFGNLKENYGMDNHRVRGIARKELNVGAKLLLFTIEKAIAVLKILQYFCNSLKVKYKITVLLNYEENIVMRRLGISVYPEHASLEENKKYITTAAKYGFDRIFTCLLSVTGDKESIVKEFKETISHAKSYNYEVIVDVAPCVFKDLDISYDDLSFFERVGVDGLRLDEGFTGAEEAMMTYNKENLMIELNVSQPNRYLENILSYCADTHNILGCHNFYPKKRSGLSRELFLKNSKNYKEHGIRVAAFINSKNATFGPWPVSEGLCTLEEHRYVEDIAIQAKDLWNSDVVDDVIIANCFASEDELKALGELRRGLLTLDVELEVVLSEVESKILYDEMHFYRGDASEYTVRSTMPRVKYREEDIKPKNTRSIKRGDVIIENSNYVRYKGELHIALRDYENEGNSNVIGKVREDNLVFIDQVRPWQKFKIK